MPKLKFTEHRGLIADAEIACHKLELEGKWIQLIVIDSNRPLLNTGDYVDIALADTYAIASANMTPVLNGVKMYTRVQLTGTNCIHEGRYVRKCYNIQVEKAMYLHIKNKATGDMKYNAKVYYTDYEVDITL